MSMSQLILLDILKYEEQCIQSYIATLYSLGVQGHLIDQHQCFCFIIFKGYLLPQQVALYATRMHRTQRDKTSN